jgi:hypothetical protein
VSLEYIQNYYKVPAKVGARVKYMGRPGTITGSRGPHIRILLDGDKCSSIYHPTWKIEYLREETGSRAA